MRLSTPLHAMDHAAGRWRAALIDRASSQCTVLLSLAFYVVLWTIYGTVAKGSQGLHYDMTEAIAWSRDLSLGYLKHPPLAAWIVRAWFGLLPLSEPSYYLLAMLMPAMALWFVWLLSADYLAIEKRVVGLALLTLIPFFNFHALKFNVNTVLMPLWAATTFWFLRSYQTRSHLYAALAGVAAAASMLGKYWSVFLLAGLAVAALIDKRRASYFRSTTPWITVAVGLVVLSPHLVWLAQHDFAPFGYAMSIHGEKPLANAALGAFGYLAGAAGYVAIPVIAVLAAARPGRAALADLVWPSEAERRLVAVAFWAPLLLPVLGAVASGTIINSLWSMAAWTLLPVLLLSPPVVTVAAADTRRVLIAALAVPLVMLIAAPVIAVMVQRAGPQPAAAHARLLAAQVEGAWRKLTPQPLRFAGGDAEIVYDVIAYASDRPRALPGMPAPSAAELRAGGMALLCFDEDFACRRDAAERALHVAGSRTIEAEIARDYFGLPGKPQRYAIVLLPPRP